MELKEIDTDDFVYGKHLGKNPKYGRFVVLQCENCGKLRYSCINLVKAGRLPINCKECADKMRCRENHPLWKGGKPKSGDYRLFYVTEDNPYWGMVVLKSTKLGVGYILEHRYVMAEYMGRCLNKNEIVHHKNGVKDDNRIENLELIESQSKHFISHHKGYQDGYKQGYEDGLNSKVNELIKQNEELLKQVKLLQWRQNNATIA